ncbi:MAG: sulfate transporter, ATPase subunit [Fibrobacteria bacterium]|nr:sulfate transporter, ATPase subunit [Fibrobacteria bacterium]
MHPVLSRSARIGIPLLALGQGLCEAGFVLSARWGLTGSGPAALGLMGGFAVLRLVFQERGAALEVQSLRRAVSALQSQLLETLRARAVPAYRPAVRRELARVLEETIPRAAEGLLARRRFAGSLLQGGVLLPGLFLLSWKIALPALAVGALAWRVLKWKNRSLRDLERSGSHGRAAERRANEEFAAGLEAASGTAWDGYLRRFSGELDAARVADWKWRRAQARYPALLETGFFFALTGLLVSGAFVLDGLDGWILFTALLVLVYRPVREAARHYPVALQGTQALDEVRALLAGWNACEPRALPPENPEPGFFALENASFAYAAPGGGHADAHPVFEDVSLKFRADEVTGITGPNGAGKTTLLRLIAGAEIPSGPPGKRGKVWWAAAARRTDPGIAYLPQRAHPGADWRAWASRLRSENPGLWEELNAVLRLENLIGKAEHPESMSGGERQRMALARAAASDAGYLLLDEPTTGLPAHEREEILAGVLRIWKRGNARGGDPKNARGALVVSHEPFLGALCDSLLDLSREARA